MVRIPQYFKKIPEWDANNTKDSFEFFNDLSALPVTRLKHWQDFQQFIDNRYDKELGMNLIFRGQRQYDWKLDSSLGRAKNSNFPFGSEEEQLNHFRQAIRGRIKDPSLLTKNETDGKDTDTDTDTDNELWSIGQHHGLMTPLLDWTYSPYVALFFAFIEEDTVEETLMPNYYRCVYMLDSEYCKKFIKDSKIKIFEPTQDEHGRLVNQNGLFTISSLDIDIEREIYNSLYDYINIRSNTVSAFMMAEYACKVYIKNEDRQGYLQNLEHMNISHKSLFPDLHGAADFCNSRIKNYIYNFQNARISEGSLMVVSVGENKKCRKDKLYNAIKTILIKTVNSSLSKDEKKEIKKRDEDIKKAILKNSLGGFILVPQIEILAGEITRQIQRLKNLPIPSHSYEALMRVKIGLILTEFDLKGLEPIKNQRRYVINKIVDIIKK